MSQPLCAATYKVGDVVQNFTYVDRTTGAPVNLTDYAGKIVVLEWFAHWCPFCRASAPEIERDVIKYYADRNGTADGVAVVKLGCNVQPDTGSNRQSTDAFVKANSFPVVINDTSPARALQGRFTATSGQPSFAIISGIANAVDRQTGKAVPQWQLLYSRFGYGATDQPTMKFRAAIDAVKVVPPAEPVVLGGIQYGAGMVSFRIAGSPRNGLVVQSSNDGATWQATGQAVPADPSAPFVEAADQSQRYYRVIRQSGF